MEQGGMNSVVMSIRGLLSLELWVPTLPVVPVSSGRNQMVSGGSGGSGGSGDSEIVGFDWSYQSRIRKWYFVNNPCKWTDLLPTAEFHHNSVPHSSTKVSPFSLLHRYELSYPIRSTKSTPAVQSTSNPFRNQLWHVLPQDLL